MKDHRLQPKTANGLTERPDGKAACALRNAQLVHKTFGVGSDWRGAQPSVRRQASRHAKQEEHASWQGPSMCANRDLPLPAVHVMQTVQGAQTHPILGAAASSVNEWWTVTSSDLQQASHRKAELCGAPASHPTQTQGGGHPAN